MHTTFTKDLVDAVLDPSDKVLPCPFCGCGDIALQHTWTASYWMECRDCGAQVSGEDGGELIGGEQPNKDPAAHKAGAASALDFWNQRVGVDGEA